MVRGSPNPLHFGLPARLRRARKQSGLTRGALARKVSRDSELATEIEAGQRMPTVGTVARLAAALGVSACWLGFGLGPQSEVGTSAATDTMKSRLQNVRIQRGITKAALARMVDLSPPALANIENGAQTSLDILEALAKALGISPAWLAYGEGPQVLPPRRRARAYMESPLTVASD